MGWLSSEGQTVNGHGSSITSPALGGFLIINFKIKPNKYIAVEKWLHVLPPKNQTGELELMQHTDMHVKCEMDGGHYLE